MLCGSSNASVAAFGLPGVIPTNHEASVGFKSPTTDYFKMTGFTLTDPIQIDEIKYTEKQESSDSLTPISLWIKESSYLYNNYDVTIENTDEVIDVIVTFYSGSRKQLEVIRKKLKHGINILKGTFKDAINPLYVEITNSKGEMISNRQFMIPTEIMDINNPSPESDYKRKRYREIEAGKFVNGEVLRFIEQILNDTETKLFSKRGNEGFVEKIIDNKDGKSYSSLSEYLRDDGSGITGDRSMRKSEKSASQSSMLFDSMISISPEVQKKKRKKILMKKKLRMYKDLKVGRKRNLKKQLIELVKMLLKQSSEYIRCLISISPILRALPYRIRLSEIK
jgi:hypothetical protein